MQLLYHIVKLWQIQWTFKIIFLLDTT